MTNPLDGRRFRDMYLPRGRRKVQENIKKWSIK
ncbi:hypothetical protein V1478_007399, partial [Vespula squamosa]